MKKITCLFLCLIYFTSSAGVFLNFHYCGGKIKTVSLSHTDEKDCCGPSMKKRDCCKEKTLSYKVKTNHHGADKTVLAKTFSKILSGQCVFSLLFILPAQTVLQVNPDFHDPPDIPQNNAYLLNGVFLI